MLVSDEGNATGQRSYVKDAVSEVSLSTAVSETIAPSIRPTDGRQPATVSDTQGVVLQAIISFLDHIILKGQ
jgi:hypothetical protein